LIRRVFLIAAFVTAGFAQPGPEPPCGNPPFPAYSETGRAPAVKVWLDADAGRNWKPPACSGWSSPGYSTLVATAARFHHTSGTEGLRRRLAAISALGGIRYWSTTAGQWQALIRNAAALESADGGRRKDFSPEELTPGRTLYFEQADNLLGKAAYRLRIRSVSASRVVFETENAGTVRYLLIPVFQPGDAQSVYFFERESAQIWRYYSLARTSAGAGAFAALAGGHEASLINRAVALYRYFAGIPTDQEPPAAR
jgi:hypothetical protein